MDLVKVVFPFCGLDGERISLELPAHNIVPLEDAVIGSLGESDGAI
jgi:hypothetical protein